MLQGEPDRAEFTLYVTYEVHNIFLTANNLYVSKGLSGGTKSSVGIAHILIPAMFVFFLPSHFLSPRAFPFETECH